LIITNPKQNFMLKKLTFILALALITFVSCKKKTDTPAPSIPSNTLTVNGGKTENLSINVDNSLGYDLNGIATPYEIGIDFEGTISSGTVTLNSYSNPTITINDFNGNDWTASSGTVTVTVTSTTITASFSNITLSADYGNAQGSAATLTATGSLTGSK